MKQPFKTANYPSLIKYFSGDGLSTYQRNQKMWRDSAHEANRIAAEKRVKRLERENEIKRVFKEAFGL